MVTNITRSRCYCTVRTRHSLCGLGGGESVNSMVCKQRFSEHFMVMKVFEKKFRDKKGNKTRRSLEIR